MATVLWKCGVCGQQACVPATAGRISCGCGYTQENGVKPGLGDYVAMVLRKRGLTSERYVAAKAVVGLKRRCWCPQRQRRLNQAGRWIGIGKPT